MKETTLRAELQAIEDELEERRGVEHRLANAVQAAERRAGAAAPAGRDGARRNVSGCARNARIGKGNPGSSTRRFAAAEAEQAAPARGDRRAMRPKRWQADAALQDASSAVQEVTRLIQERRGAYLDAMDKVSRVRNDLARVESLLRTSEGRTARLHG